MIKQQLCQSTPIMRNFNSDHLCVLDGVEDNEFCDVDKSIAYTPRMIKTIEQKYPCVMCNSPYHYALDKDIENFGFLTADRVAKKMGIPENNIERKISGMVYVLQEILETSEDIFIDMNLFIDECVKKNVSSSADDIKQLINVYSDIFVVRETSVTLIEHQEQLDFCLQVCNKLSTSLPDIDLSENIIKSNPFLSENQQLAIKEVFKKRFTIITGPAGSGKTTIISKITQAVVEQYENKESDYKISLLAFTGRASQNMRNALSPKVLNYINDKEESIVECKTIHKALKITPDYLSDRFKYRDKRIIIVDETSMVCLDLFYRLMLAISDNPNIILILVGDNNQLPPVGIGQIFKILYIYINDIHNVALNYVYRQGEGSKILKFANQIIDPNRNNPIRVKDIDCGKEINVIALYNVDLFRYHSVLSNLVKNYINTGYSIYDDILILSAYRKGIVGVNVLNNIVRQVINPFKTHAGESGIKFFLHDKVMQIKNNYRIDVMNGEVGKVIRVNKDGITVLFNKINREVFYTYENAYANLDISFVNTVHKSQGGEYPIVISIIYAGHYMLLTKKLLYTAVSRAKKKLDIITDGKGLYLSSIKEK